MLYRLVVNFLCEAKLVDEIPIKSLLEIINHDGTFLYHLMKRLGVDVSSIHNRLYHQSHKKSNILSNHEVMLAFIATSGISPTLLPAPKVLYTATKEGIAANLIYQVLRCIYRKRLRQSENYIVKMANYLNALYTLRSEPVYQLTSFSKHTNLPSSLVKLSLSTSCISLSMFVAGVHRFLTESGVPCIDFLANFYKFPTTLQHMTRNHAKMQHLLMALGVPLFFSPLAWLSIKDEEPYFDLRLIQIYLIFDKFRGCVSTILFKKLKNALFAPRSLDPALPQPINLPWRDALHNTITDPQDELLAFAKSTDLNMDFDDISNSNDIEQNDSKKLADLGISCIYGRNDSAPIILSSYTGQEMVDDEYGNSLPKILPHEAEHLMMVLSELPEPHKSATNQGSGSPTHYREAKTNRIRNVDPLSATHPIYSDEEHHKLIEARSHKSLAPTYVPDMIEESVENENETVDEATIENGQDAIETLTADAGLKTDQIIQSNQHISTKEQLECRVQEFLGNGIDFTSDISESQELLAPMRNESKEDPETSPVTQEAPPSKHKESSSPPGVLHMQIHHINNDTIRHKSSLPHPCSMSPSAHKLSDECVQRSFRNHCEVITDSEDEVCSTITPDQIREKYHICFIPSPVANNDHVSNKTLSQNEIAGSTVKAREYDASGDEMTRKQELYIGYSESEDDPPLASLPPPPPPCLFIPYIAKQSLPEPNPPQSSNTPPNNLDDRSSTDTQEYDLSGIVLKNPSPKAATGDVCAQNFDIDSSYSDNFQFTVGTNEQGQAQIEYLTQSKDKISSGDFRPARVGLLSQSGSGKINSAQLQTINSPNYVTEQLEQLANDLSLEHGSVVSLSCSATKNPVSSIPNLDVKAMEAQARYITQFPIKVQRYIHEKNLIALSAIPPSLLKDRAALPIDLTRTFMDINGYIYRLYGLDFIRISIDGSVHIEPDEDLESDNMVLKASLSASNIIDSLVSHNIQPDQVETLAVTHQSFVPSSNLIPPERTESMDHQVPQHSSGHEDINSLKGEPNVIDFPLVQSVCLALPTSDALTSTNYSSYHASAKYSGALQDALSNEAKITSEDVIEPCLTEDHVPIPDDCIYQQEVYPPLNNNVAPLVCLNDLGDAGEAFLDTENTDQSLQSNHVLVHDIYLPNDLDDREIYSGIDGHSSVFSAQSMRKSAGISSASSKRSLNPMLSISSYTSRPNSSRIDHEIPHASDTIVITEVPNDPIVAHVESPNTDRLVTAHGSRQNPNQNVGITPDPSTVYTSDEQSRPSTSSIAFNFTVDTQTMPAFDLTPQIQLENLLTSRFMDRFIDSYLRRIQFKAPGINKCTTVDAAVDTEISKEEGVLSSNTTKLKTITSFEQKLNQYVHSTSHRNKTKSSVGTAAGHNIHQSKPQTMQRQSEIQTGISTTTRPTIRTAHLSASTSARNTQTFATNNNSNIEQPLPPAFSNLNKEQISLYHQINDAAHLNDNSPQLRRKLRNNKLAFSVPIRSPVQRFMYTLKCLNIDSSRITSETTLFSVLRNNNSGFYLGIYARQYIILRIEISDIYKMERNLCQVYLYFRRAFVATGDNLLFAHFDLLDERNAQSFVRDLTTAVEIVKPLIHER